MDEFQLGVWFPTPNQASVSLRQQVADQEVVRLYETMLFTLFAARHIANGRGDSASLMIGNTLFGISEEAPLSQVEQDWKGALTVTSQTNQGGGRGFTAEFKPDTRAFFKLHFHGLGMMGRHAADYARPSVIALFLHLLRRRSDEAEYQRALGLAAKGVGAAAVSGMLTVTSQAQIAMQSAAAAWMQPDMLPSGYQLGADADDPSLVDEEGGGLGYEVLLPDDYATPADIAAACEQNGVEFADLYCGAAVMLHAAIEQTKGEGAVILPKEVATRICREELATSTDMHSPEARLTLAWEAMRAAEQTGEAEMIKLSTAHYDRLLEQELRERGLLPVADELESLLFTNDPERAAGT